jgi:ATP synthase protein I
MPQGPPNSKDHGYYFALAQVGLEMVIPVGLGMLLDNSLGWSPWATAGGAIFGLAGGLTHLVWMLNRRENSGSSRPRRDAE